MKFTEKLSTHLTPEWRSQYINYEELKNTLQLAVEDAPLETFDLFIQKRYYQNFDESFFRQCEKELDKVNTFFVEKMAEAHRKFSALQMDMNKCLDMAERKGQVSRIDLRPLLTKRKAKDLKFSYSEFYLSLVLLQNYQSLNYTGFRKILKKHDKLFHSESGQAWFLKKVETAQFYTNKDIMRLIHNTETIFTNHLEGGDRSRAMKRLRVPPLGENQHPWTTFRLGLFSGVFIVLATLIYISVQKRGLPEDEYVACLLLHRGSFLLIIFLFMFGLNVIGWNKAGVNYILIFEIEPRDHLTATQIMEMAAAFGVMWALSILGFIYSQYLKVAPYLFPLTLLLCTVLFVINPLQVCHYPSRMWLLHLMGRVIAAPFFHVGFADFWLGDQLNSLVTCLVDYEYILCFYLTNGSFNMANDPWHCIKNDFVVNPIVRCLPAWFRFAQCLRRYHDTHQEFPFLVNAGKYASSFPVVYFATSMVYYRGSYNSNFENPYVWAFFISHIFSSIYCYIWDMFKDFGVFQKNYGENTFLREQIVYIPSFYYFAIIEDLLLRFFWIFQFVLIDQKIATTYNLHSVEGCLEVLRRYIWNYFRLENEHLNNAGQFRAVRDISVVPLDATDKYAMQRMMDEMDEVGHHH